MLKWSHLLIPLCPEQTEEISQWAPIEPGSPEAEPGTWAPTEYPREKGDEGQ